MCHSLKPKEVTVLGKSNSRTRISGGASMVLLSVLLDRIKAAKRDPYKGVEK